MTYQVEFLSKQQVGDFQYSLERDTAGKVSATRRLLNGDKVDISQPEEEVAPKDLPTPKLRSDYYLLTHSSLPEVA